MGGGLGGSVYGWVGGCVWVCVGACGCVWVSGWVANSCERVTHKSERSCANTHTMACSQKRPILLPINNTGTVWWQRRVDSQIYQVSTLQKRPSFVGLICKRDLFIPLNNIGTMGRHRRVNCPKYQMAKLQRRTLSVGSLPFVGF